MLATDNAQMSRINSKYVKKGKERAVKKNDNEEMTLKHSRLQHTIDSFPIPLNKGTNFVRHHADDYLWREQQKNCFCYSW